mmetsp:Transcript_35274/g.105371  ORF Transcript_35274/g.105371 Transcript_35274/m.105371 type:complete len:94 (+) Transcript_35274:812-1093(+)
MPVRRFLIAILFPVESTSGDEDASIRVTKAFFGAAAGANALAEDARRAEIIPRRGQKKTNSSEENEKMRQGHNHSLTSHVENYFCCAWCLKAH